jgi:S1-C subfamily serine protease
MQRIKRIATSPLGSGAVGGLLVAAICAIALAAGWVGDENAATSAQASLGAPAEVPLTDQGLTVNQIYARVAPGVAYIEAQQASRTAASPIGPIPQGGGTATGSGFVLDTDGHILTNAHVVTGASQIEVKLGDQAPVEAKLVGRDPSTDLAVLEVDPDKVDLHPVPLADSNQVRVGDPVVAIGNPFGLDRTATAGIVSAVQREIQSPNGFSISDAIQTDAPINPGNSGGPLLAATGRVIGITSQIATGGGGGGSVGIGFAVPSSTVQDVAQQLLDNGTVEHAFLGITGADISPQLADALNLPVEQGALVEDVTRGGPADDAGIQGGDQRVSVEGQPIAAGGDVITAVDGQQVTGMDDLIAAVNAKQVGDQVQLDVLRDGNQQQITVTLGERPNHAG